MSQDGQGQGAQTTALAIAQQRILEIIAQGSDELSLSGLGLVDFPDLLCQQLMRIENLRSLDLSDNSLYHLPESIGQLTSLQVLSLSDNPLSALPERLGELRQLRVLDISGTGVTGLPEGIQRLVEARSLMLIQQPAETTRGYEIFPSPNHPGTLFEEASRRPKGIEREYRSSEQPSDYVIAPAFKAQLSEIPVAEAPAQTRSLTKDWINVSVFSPKQVISNNSFLVQVFAYLPEQFRDVRETALMTDETAQQVAKKKLGVQVERNTDLVFELVMPGLEIDDPVQSLRWQGWEDSAMFGVSVPVEVTQKTMIGTVTVSQKSVPIGHLKFRVTVVSETTSDEPTLTGEDARRYEKAFVSYSSKDRTEVLKRVQGLNATGIEVFQDVLDLEPGDRWEKELYKNIDECDLFLLFWSTAAKESPWVLKEAKYALDLQAKDDLQLPAIKPVILEGPPIVTPPDELKDLHFNDLLIYLINQS